MILEFLRAETIGVLLSIAFVFELIAEGVVVEVVSEFTLPIAEAANRTQRVVMVVRNLGPAVPVIAVNPEESFSKNINHTNAKCEWVAT